MWGFKKNQVYNKKDGITREGVFFSLSLSFFFLLHTGVYMIVGAGGFGSSDHREISQNRIELLPYFLIYIY